MKKTPKHDMEELLGAFPNEHLRDYSGGTEIRTQNLEEALAKARKTIERKKLALEIFGIHPTLRSFSVRPKKTGERPQATVPSETDGQNRKP